MWDVYRTETKIPGTRKTSFISSPTLASKWEGARRWESNLSLSQHLSGPVRLCKSPIPLSRCRSISATFPDPGRSLPPLLAPPPPSGPAWIHSPPLKPFIRVCHRGSRQRTCPPLAFVQPHTPLQPNSHVEWLDVG